MQNKGEIVERFFEKDYKYPVKQGDGVDLENIAISGVLYDVGCQNEGCGLSARSQGENAKRLYLQFTQEGCPCCGGKKFVIKEVDVR